MKNIIYSTLIIGLLTLFSSNIYAQGKVKMQAKEKVEQTEQDVKNTLDNKKGKTTQSNGKGKTSKSGGLKGQTGQGKVNDVKVIEGKGKGKIEAQKGKVIQAGDKVKGGANDNAEVPGGRERSPAPDRTPKEKPKTSNTKNNNGKAKGRSTTPEPAAATTVATDDAPKEEVKKDKSNKGKPYWENPDGLTGKEFGQERARQAKLHKEQRKSDLDRSIGQAEAKITAANEKIQKATEELDAAKKARKVTNDSYDIKKGQIEKAQKGVEDLEQKVQKAKGL